MRRDGYDGALAELAIGTRRCLVDTQWVMSEESTTPDLVALALKQLEAVNRHDLDALMDVYAPNVVYDTSTHGLGVHTGSAAMRGLIKDYWEAFEDLTFELEEFLDLGNGITFHVVRQYARPVGSSQHVQTREAHVSEWVDGMIVRVMVYLDIDEGRAAAERLAEWSG
jgi:ketosteroid isomerase-like protein